MIRANKDEKASIIIYKAPSPKQNGFYLGAMGFFFRAHGLYSVSGSRPNMGAMIRVLY